MDRPGERMVTLVDGTSVSNYSEEWRLECEARTVCEMPRKIDRRMHLQAVEAKRGKAARERLEDAVWRVWNAGG